MHNKNQNYIARHDWRKRSWTFLNLKTISQIYSFQIPSNSICTFHRNCISSSKQLFSLLSKSSDLAAFQFYSNTTVITNLNWCYWQLEERQSFSRHATYVIYRCVKIAQPTDTKKVGIRSLGKLSDPVPTLLKEGWETWKQWNNTKIPCCHKLSPPRFSFWVLGKQDNLDAIYFTFRARNM